MATQNLATREIGWIVSVRLDGEQNSFTFPTKEMQQDFLAEITSDFPDAECIFSETCVTEAVQ